MTSIIPQPSTKIQPIALPNTTNERRKTLPKMCTEEESLITIRKKELKQQQESVPSLSSRIHNRMVVRNDIQNGLVEQRKHCDSDKKEFIKHGLANGVQFLIIR